MDIVNDENKESILYKLRVLRSQHYAHSDQNFIKLTSDLFPTFNEVWDLMKIIETFLKDLYGQIDSEPILDVDNKINDYLDEFKITYEYFKRTSDFVEKTLLVQAVGKVRAEAYFNS